MSPSALFDTDLDDSRPRSVSVSNGHVPGPKPDRTESHGPKRAKEIQVLLSSVLDQLIPFIHQADDEVEAHQLHRPVTRTALVEEHSPAELRSILAQDGTLSLPGEGTGEAGLLRSLRSILKYSVNTSSPGFLDKLYSAPLPPGIAAELILSVLNTNVHVYHVSPALSLIETNVTKALARLFGFDGPRAGGINVQGGSASNVTSVVIARNTLFPDTKTHGNTAAGRELVLFTSEHGHYSIEKAAQQCGLGSHNVVAVPVVPTSGEMDPQALESLVLREKARGRTPFYVNATAGTTVLGSFDPFTAIAQIARTHGMWLHIDGAWGGSFAFSESLRYRALRGCELADSIAINPHKMLGAPVTCSFLLLRDLQHAHTANTLRAAYLFHDADEQVEEGNHADADDAHHQSAWRAPEDLADLTLQCGRRGDSLKLFLSWQYYGTRGYQAKIEQAYGVAGHLANLVDRHPDLLLVSTNPPPCLQVCFYLAPAGRLSYLVDEAAVDDAAQARDRTVKLNSSITRRIAQRLVARGFMVDYAPALSHQAEKGAFFRVVVNISTPRQTVERLVEEIVTLGKSIRPDGLDEPRGQNV